MTNTKIIKIPLKLPSCNEYINKCRANRYAGAEMKKQAENEIMLFLGSMPKCEKPVEIEFHWIEANKRRDLDNICFAKKFILDALVKAGKLKDDNRKNVTAFRDVFSYGEEYCVILTVKELENGNY